MDLGVRDGLARAGRGEEAAALAQGDDDPPDSLGEQRVGGGEAGRVVDGVDAGVEARLRLVGGEEVGACEEVGGEFAGRGGVDDQEAGGGGAGG